MDSLYRIWLTIYPYNRNASESTRVLLIYMCFYSICILSQSLRFFWQTESQLSNWSGYKDFWIVVSAVSVDCVADIYNFIPSYVILVIAFSSFTVMIFFVLVIFIELKKKVPHFFISVVRMCIFIMCDLMFIPIVTLFFIIFKYSSKDGVGVEEFSKNVTSDMLDYGTWGYVLSAVFLVVIGVFTMFYEACAYEIRLISNNGINGSKSNSKACALIRIFQFANCFLATELKPNNYEVFLIICFLLYLGCAAFLVYYLPYYCFVPNLLKVFVNVDCAFVCLVFWIGYKMDRVDIVVLITVLMQIPIFLLVKETIRYRELHLPNFLDCTHCKFRYFELSIRLYLSNGALNDDLISYLVLNNIKQPNKFNYIIQAYYCSDTLNKKMLGLNRIIGVSSSGIDIFTNFQVFKCKNILKEECLLISEGFKMHQYFVDFFEVKERDKNFCIEYMDFIEKVNRKIYNFGELRGYVNRIATGAKDLKRKYEKILERFPSSNDPKSLLGSLLINVLYDVENGNRYIEKAHETRMGNFKGFLKHHLSFSSGRAFVVLSGNPKTIGQLIYFTNNFLDFIRIKRKEALGMSVNNLLPKDFREFHDGFLLKFLESATHTEVFKCSPSFMLDSRGFLLECTLSSEAVGCVDSVNFMCAVDIIQKNKERGYSFMHPSGLLKEHSSNFPQILGVTKKFLENIFIQEIFEDFSFDDFIHEDYVQVRFNKQSQLINLLIKDVMVGKVTLKIMYACFDTETEHKLRKLSTFDIKNLEHRRISFLLAADERMDTVLQADHQEKLFDEKGNLLEKSVPNAQSSTVVMPAIPESKYIRKSMKALAMAKCALLISLLAILLSTAAILVYISEEVTRLVSLTAIVNLSDTMHSASSLALLTRISDINTRTMLYSNFNLTSFPNIIKDLRYNQEDLFNDYDSWSDCPSSSLLTSMDVNYWDLDPDPVLKQDSLLNIIRSTIKHVKNIQAEEIIKNPDINSPDYNRHLFFIIYNGIGGVFSTSFKTLEELSICEAHNAEVLRLNSFYLILSVTMFQGLLVICLIFFIVQVDRSLKVLWIYLLKRVLGSSAEIMQMLKERLFEHHEISRSVIISPSLQPGNNNSCVCFEHSSRYVYRVFFIFIFVGAVYIVSYSVFVISLSELLTLRPYLTKSIAQQKAQIMHLSFFTIENDIKKADFSTSEILKAFYPIKNPENALNSIVEDIKLSRTIENSKKSLTLLNEKLHVMIFEAMEGSTFTRLGIYRAAELLIQESIFIAFNNKQDKSEEIVGFLNDVIEFNAHMQDITEELKKVSAEVIKNKLTDFVAFVIVCCFGLALLYCTIVYPFLRSELKTITSIMNILIVLPLQTNLNYSTGLSKNFNTIKHSEKT